MAKRGLFSRSSSKRSRTIQAKPVARSRAQARLNFSRAAKAGRVKAGFVRRSNQAHKGLITSASLRAVNQKPNSGRVWNEALHPRDSEGRFT